MDPDSDATVAKNEPADTFVYMSAPQINELCCAMCEIDSVEAIDSTTKSQFHWQRIKCRLLLHMVPEVMASPVQGAEGYIFIVAGKDYFASGKLHFALSNLKLLFIGLRPLTPDIYKICLGHTIRSKVAPFWNQVGRYLVEGKEFYKSSAGARALKLKILIDGESTRLQMQAGKVRMQCATLEDFYIPQAHLAEFLVDSKGHMDFAKYIPANVHVLPSMKKGKVLSVWKQIPERCPFKDYHELRRHWKNMYGYSLPKNNDGILFYEIKFPVPYSDIFTYPDLCLTAQPTQLVQSWDANSTIKQFLLDMQKAVVSICGRQLYTCDGKFVNVKTPHSQALYSTRLSLPPLPDPCKPGPSVDSGYKSEILLNSSTNSPAQDKGQIASTSSVEPSSSRLITLDEVHGTAAAQSNCTAGFHVGRVNIRTITKISKRKSTTTGEENISSYFKVKKVCKTVCSKEDWKIEKKSQQNLSLREKLRNKKANMTDDES